MTNFFPIGELIDRLVIARIKAEKLDLHTNELQWYEQAILDFDISSIHSEIQQLKEAHLKIWEMESLLKSGLEQKLSLDEIGRRAIAIRNYNKERIVIKNQISIKMNCNVVEIKKDHLSE